jgi:hypothetical protein
MAKMTKRQEDNAARPEDEIDALIEELRTVDARKIIEGLREQVRQWKESDVYASWPLDMQLQIVGMELSPIFGDGLKDQAAAVWV